MKRTNPVDVIIQAVSPADIRGHWESEPDMNSEAFPENVAPRRVDISSNKPLMITTETDDSHA